MYNTDAIIEIGIERSRSVLKSKIINVIMNALIPKDVGELKTRLK